MKHIAAAILLALVAPSLAQAQDTPACPAQPAPATVTAASDTAGLGKAILIPGQAALVTLHPTGQISYPIQPEKPGGSVAHGGLVSVVIPAAGTWQVALSSGAWIDVLQNGAAVVSTAHGHAPNCSGLHKMVDFPLTSGLVTIQISANADPIMTVMVSRKP